MARKLNPSGTGDEKRQASPLPLPQRTRCCVTVTHKGRLLMAFRAPGGSRCIPTVQHVRTFGWKKLMPSNSSQNKQHGYSHWHKPSTDACSMLRLVTREGRTRLAQCCSRRLICKDSPGFLKALFPLIDSSSYLPPFVILMLNFIYSDILLTCVCVGHVCSACGGQKRLSLRLELLMVTAILWVLGI